jgi:hypothetical protein
LWTKNGTEENEDVIDLFIKNIDRSNKFENKVDIRMVPQVILLMDSYDVDDDSKMPEASRSTLIDIRSSDNIIIGHNSK